MINLRYFLGKVCTVFTSEINFHFKFEQMSDYFTGKIDEMDETGIVLVHPITGCKTFIATAYIVGIAEEQVLDPDNPQHAKLIKEMSGRRTK